MVDLTIYRCSLVAALSLMIFFSLTFLLGRVPSMPSAMRYVSARRRMGWALLILSANYAVHLFAMPRLSDIGMTIFMNTTVHEKYLTFQKVTNCKLLFKIEPKLPIITA